MLSKLAIVTFAFAMGAQARPSGSAAEPSSGSPSSTGADTTQTDIPGEIYEGCSLPLSYRGWTDCDNIFEPYQDILKSQGSDSFHGQIWYNVQGEIQRQFGENGDCNFLGIDRIRFYPQYDYAYDYYTSRLSVWNGDTEITFRCPSRNNNLVVRIDGPSDQTPTRLDWNSPWYSGVYGSVLYNQDEPVPRGKYPPLFQTDSGSARCRVVFRGEDEEAFQQFVRQNAVLDDAPGENEEDED
eukprot:Clim_evm16s46 gene=Clim_evmTU16s46